ncbi:hypothetical protein RKD37_008370 [Streptomyces ambofaciens]
MTTPAWPYWSPAPETDIHDRDLRRLEDRVRKDSTEGARGVREHPAVAVVAARTGRPQHTAARPGTCPARGLGGDAVLLVAAGVVQGDGDAVATRPAHRPAHGARPADDLLTSLLRDSARDDDVCLPLCHREVARASDGGHRVRRSRGGSDDGKAAVRGVQDRQELRQL